MILKLYQIADRMLGMYTLHISLLIAMTKSIAKTNLTVQISN